MQCRTSVLLRQGGRRLRCHKRPAALVGRQDTVPFHFGVGLDHRVRVDRELNRKCSDGRQLFARIQETGGNSITDKVLNLPINRDTTLGVELECYHVLDNYNTSTIDLSVIREISSRI